MLIKIKREEAIQTYPDLPLRHYVPKEDEEVIKYPKVYANYILSLPAKSYRGYIRLLGKQIAWLTSELGSASLIFMGDVEIPWLRRSKDHEAGKVSFQYLTDHKVGVRFNGALKVNSEQLLDFMKHLAWLVRTNGIMQYVYYVDEHRQLIGTICQYGNLHISTMDKKADKEFNKAITKSAFKFLNSGSCYNRFSKTGRIKGRTIPV